MADNGVSISASQDGAIYNVFAGNQNFIIQDIGDEFALTTQTDSLIIEVGSGEALLSGRHLTADAPNTLTIPANTKSYLCLEIDLTQTQGNEGTLKALTEAQIKNDNLNAGGTVCDLLLYVIETDTNGVIKTQDRRQIRNTSAPNEIAPCIIVTAKAEDTVTVTDGTTTYTQIYVDKPLYFYLNKRGTWTVSTTEKTEEVNVTANQDYEVNLAGPNFHIYGITKDITLASTVWTRTNDSANFTAKASVGTVAGHSDFDKCYPWSEMKRETLSTNDVMVKIPKFWFKRYREGNQETILIGDSAELESQGFTLHPAFKHNNTTQECVYVGAFAIADNNKSVTGVVPTTQMDLNGFRNNARPKGAGWSLWSLLIYNAIEMLYLVEYADNNSQSVVGRGYVDSMSTNLVNGSCNSVPNLTGIPSGTNGKIGVVYRGLENLWGNVHQLLDGVYVSARYNWKYTPEQGKFNSPVEYIDTNVKSNTTAGYIGEMSYDINNPALMLPIKTSGSETTSFCDHYKGDTSEDQNTMLQVTVGGYRGGVGMAGLFCTHAYQIMNTKTASISSRLMYIPQEV